MRNYIKQFFAGEEGVETIEFIGVIVVAAVLIAVVAGIASNYVGQLTSEGSDSMTNMENSLKDLEQTADINWSATTPSSDGN